MTAPDIVLIMTDQQRHDQVGYIDPRFDTPNLNRLATTATVFERATSASTTCVPARSSILTGLSTLRYPTTTDGAGLALAEGFWTVAHGMRAAGYHTALVGKMHFSPIHAKHGFDTMRMCEQITPLGGYGVAETDEYQESLPVDDRRRHDGTTVVHPQVYPGDPEHHPIAWVVREALQVLRNRTPGVPLFLVISFIHPHGPVLPSTEFSSKYSPSDEVIEDESFSVNDQLPAAWFNQALKRADGIEPETRRTHLALHRALVAQLDAGIGAIVEAIPPEAAIVFTSDHGDYAGHRGLLSKLPWIPFDDLCRVPLIVRPPSIDGGRPGSNRWVASPVQTTDLTPTFLDWARSALPRTVDGNDAEFAGRSLLPILADEPSADRDARDRVLFCTMRIGPRTAARGPHKLIKVNAFELVLFDLERDPTERVSFVGDPAYTDVVTDLESALAAEFARPIPDLGTWGRE